MAITIQFLFGLLMVTQICCVEDTEIILENGETFTVHDTSVKFENFFFNHTHVQNLVEYKIEGAIGSNVTNLTLVLDAMNAINLDNKTKPFLIKCDISLRSPNDEFSQTVFQRLEDLIYDAICINADSFTDSVFDTIIGNNDVQFHTITSISEKVGQIIRGSISKYDEHQEGTDTVVDMTLAFVMKELNLSYININKIVIPKVTVRNMLVGNLTTLTRTRPLKIYRKNDTLTVDATFKIRPHLLFTIWGKIWYFTVPEMKLTAFAEKIEVGIKLNFDYSVEPCRIELIHMNLAKEKLAVGILDQGFVAKLFNTLLPFLESFLTPERLLPPIKKELQKLLDSKDLRSGFESLRPIFLRV